MSSSESPFVSIIVPAYDDPNGLRDTLECLVAQTYSKFEIIVSITPSTGETLRVAKEFSTSTSVEVTTVEVPDRGRAAGRNAGIGVSNGIILAFVDADIKTTETWLEESIAEMNKRNADYMACDVRFQECDGKTKIFDRYERALSLPIQHYIEEFNFAPTASLFVSQDLINSVGKFDSRLMSSEDKEFGIRAHEAGYELHFAPSLVMYHPTRSTFKSQYKKALRIGRGTQQLYDYYPNRFSIPCLLSPIPYLPPHPLRLQSRIASNEYCPSFIEYVIFYFLNYFFKLVQQLGRWKEYTKNSRAPSM